MTLFRPGSLPSSVPSLPTSAAIYSHQVLADGLADLTPEVPELENNPQFATILTTLHAKSLHIPDRVGPY